MAIYNKNTGLRVRSGDGSMSLTTAKAMMKAGQFTDAAVQTMKAAGYNDAALAEIYGYGKVQTDEYGDTVRTKLDYSPDEGVFTWNGKVYGSIAALANDLDAAGLSETELAQLDKKLRVYGYSLG